MKNKKQKTKFNSAMQNSSYRPIVRIVCWALALIMALGTVSGTLIYLMV